MKTCRPRDTAPVKESLPGVVDVRAQHRPVQGLSEALATVNRKVREGGEDPLLLAWYERSTGMFSPRVDCCGEDRPSWQVYAESRGANLTVWFNGGEYVFLYRREPDGGKSREP